MKAIVINLDSAVERMTFQRKQLNNFGVDYIRLPAVLLSTDDLVYKKFSSTWERKLKSEEVACFLSHKNAWGLVLKSNKPFLIIEDDAYFSKTINCVLKELETLTNIDYINIEVTGTNKKKLLATKATKEICESKLFRLYQGRSGAGGYILWPSGARKLLGEFENGKIGLADKFINNNYSLLSYQLDPAVLIQLDQCVYHSIKAPLDVDSSITPKSNSNSIIDKCIKCKFRRFISQVKTGVNHIAHLHHASKRKVKISKNLTLK